MDTREITQKYLKQQNISGAGFATAVKNSIGQHGSISRQTVHNWTSGAAIPDYYFLAFLAMKDAGWLGDWAVECLRVQRPGLW